MLGPVVKIFVNVKSSEIKNVLVNCFSMLFSSLIVRLNCSAHFVLDACALDTCASDACALNVFISVQWTRLARTQYMKLAYEQENTSSSPPNPCYANKSFICNIQGLVIKRHIVNYLSIMSFSLIVRLSRNVHFISVRRMRITLDSSRCALDACAITQWAHLNLAFENVM